MLIKEIFVVVEAISLADPLFGAMEQQPYVQIIEQPASKALRSVPILSILIAKKWLNCSCAFAHFNNEFVNRIYQG